MVSNLLCNSSFRTLILKLTDFTAFRSGEISSSLSAHLVIIILYAVKSAKLFTFEFQGIMHSPSAVVCSFSGKKGFR